MCRPADSTPSESLLRPAQLSDVAELARLQAEGWRSYAPHLPDSFLKRDELQQEMATMWHRLLTRQQLPNRTSTETVMVYPSTEGLLGVVTFGACQDPDCSTPTGQRLPGVEVDEIIGLWVSASARSGGIGALLLRHALQRCQRPVRVWVLKQNLRGQQFYLREGAQPGGMERSYLLTPQVGVTDTLLQWTTQNASADGPAG